MQRHFISFKRWLKYKNPSTDVNGLTTEQDKKTHSDFVAKKSTSLVLKSILNPVTYQAVVFTNWVRELFSGDNSVIKTGLKSGHYDNHVLMLHGCFNLLVDFVEKEKAAMLYASEGGKLSRFDRINFRSREAGTKYLDWEITLDSPDMPKHEQSPCQAKNAREQYALYLWWKDVRPLREKKSYHVDDDMEKDFVKQYGTMYHFDDNWKTEHPEQYDRWKQHQEYSIAQDQLWEKEDQEMLIRLIRINRSLWT